MKLGMYGGSFNPPHLGHLRLAKEMCNAVELDKLVIIPSNISPQKENNGSIEPVHRINMCKSAFCDDVFTVSDCEIARGGKSYTFDTLNYLKEQYNPDELYLFMGSDMLLSFHHWYRYNDILNMCTLVAICREKDETASLLKDYANTVLNGGKVIILDIEPFEVSSSQIREKLKECEDVSFLLLPETLEYIKEHNIYG